MDCGNTSSIYIDRVSIRHALTARDPAWQQPQPQTWRATRDIVFDWMMIFVSAWTVYRVGWVITPIALVIIGNRQRALGNLLHEASHGNLSAHRQINDCLARLLLAAPLLTSLSVYRDQHARHHAWLGDPRRDPDVLLPLAHKGDRWYMAYARYLAKPTMLRGSVMGHFSGKHLSGPQQFELFTWWLATGLSIAMVDLRFAALFGALWLGARITVFHAITTFREMTDHHGLRPGGIFSFTREIPDHGPLSVLLHPHHNGYHLTHHLFPAVPYHQLPKLHTRLMELDVYCDRAFVCRAYLNGFPSGVAGWGAHHG
jgi:fatty acid desaturase